MSEQTAVAVTPAPIAPGHENLLERAEDWFRGGIGGLGAGGGAAAPAVADELKPLLRGHAADVLILAGKVLADPSLKALAPDVLELAGFAARIGVLAL